MSATLLMPGCAVASARPAPRAAWGEAPREVFERFVDLLYRRHQVRAAFESCVVASGYRDHAADGFGSRAGAMALLGAKLGVGGSAVDVLHSAFDGDIGMVHLAVRAPGAELASARVEIFRVAAGRIVEHWSVAA